MKKLIGSLALVAALAAPAALAGEGENCHDKATTAAKSEVSKLGVAELAKLRQDPAKKTHVVDANTADFRAKNGVIPGAILLTSSARYDAAKELPAAKAEKLVFYCANQKCGASHQAAARAMEAGYTDVSVLPVGLTGWKDAGQKVASLPQS
ncbi:MAG: rhodanese-like domain-containing protein [Myxococcaceae bacterium]|nr:rhodanese-like domain-containing protein [Myxococcaceae bacterium]